MAIIFDMPEEQSSIIKVIGVGGGGSNAVNYMYDQGISGVNFVICNTDNQALEMSPIPNKIKLGPTLTSGRGAGSVPEVGKNATIESEDEIRDLLSINTKMVFVTAGMGGGTGTGGAPVVARIARELGILTVGIVTIPFDFEGRRKREKAEQGMLEMKKNVDAMIVISNNKLRDIYGNLSLKAAFGNADSILSTAAKGISEIITKSGLINVDFEDVKTVMVDSGVALMGTGRASGENRAIQAVDAAMSSPLLNDDDIHGAKGILLNISSGDDDIRMDEVTEITEYVQQAAANETEIIWGVCYDETLEDDIAVTLIATGFDGKSIDKQPETKEVIVHKLDGNENQSARADEQDGSAFISVSGTPRSSTVPSPADPEEEPSDNAGPMPPPSTPEPIITKPKENEGSTMFFLSDEEESDEQGREDDVKDSENDARSISDMATVVDPEEYGFSPDASAEDPVHDHTQQAPVENSAPEASVPGKEQPPYTYELFSEEPEGNMEMPPQHGPGPDGPVQQPNMENVQRNRMQKLRNIMSLNKIRTNKNLNDMESEPAYVRKNVSLNDVPQSGESKLSNYSLEENSHGQPEIRENNSFLHDNVD